MRPYLVEEHNAAGAVVQVPMEKTTSMSTRAKDEQSSVGKQDLAELISSAGCVNSSC